jgi:hypothetical protein
MDMARTWTRLGLEAEHVAPTKGDVLQFVQATPLLKTRVRESVHMTPIGGSLSV